MSRGVEPGAGSPFGFVLMLTVFCSPATVYFFYASGYSLGESLVFGGVVALVCGVFMFPAIAIVMIEVAFAALWMITAFSYAVTEIL